MTFFCFSNRHLFSIKLSKLSTAVLKMQQGGSGSQQVLQAVTTLQNQVPVTRYVSVITGKGRFSFKSKLRRCRGATIIFVRESRQNN